MPAKRGIKEYGQKAVAAIIQEFKQLNDGVLPGKPVICPIDPNKLSKNEKREALNAVNLIKYKHGGEIKGRTCANGSVQREYIGREESTSPTASTDAVILTAIIDAKTRKRCHGGRCTPCIRSNSDQQGTIEERRSNYYENSICKRARPCC